jgi:hypothetical protein
VLVRGTNYHLWILVCIAVISPILPSFETRVPILVAYP